MGTLGRKEGAGAMTKKLNNNNINECQNHFLTSDEMLGKKYFFLDLVYYI